MQGHISHTYTHKNNVSSYFTSILHSWFNLEKLLQHIKILVWMLVNFIVLLQNTWDNQLANNCDLLNIYRVLKPGSV